MKTLAVVTRGGYVESIHQGFICVVDSEGRVIYQKGDINTSIFFRSAAKPIQIIPFIHSGGAQKMGYSLKEIAIACASHTGEVMHQETVLGILRRLGLNTDDLHCGIMSPYNHDENKRLIARNEKPTVLHVSCSGKHAAMLAYCRYKGYDIRTYEKPDHPVQKEILKTLSYFTGEEEDTIATGTDGCGLPIFMLPIKKIALSYARIVQYAQDRNSEYYEACKTIFEAMNEYPEMVAGTKEFCTELMQATKGKLIAKIGAESVYCVGVKDKKLGMCIKIADGGERAVFPVVMEMLLELDVLDKSEYEKLKHWHRAELLNHRKENVGDIIPVFRQNDDIYIGQKIK
ncbi:MAG: asparaginase [Clostridiaceae bacterium]|nr:asparaginase [Clostridiaceae bacterium]